MTDQIRLNLGAGEDAIPGFISIDHKLGTEAYPLDYPDNSVQEILASHILEHFSHQKVKEVVADWVRVLIPGGRLRVAVPDFAQIVSDYQKGGGELDLQSVIMGAQVDDDDYHKSVFTTDALEGLFKGAGLGNIQEWDGRPGRTESYTISLRRQGRKIAGAEVLPVETKPPVKAISAAMSMPRLAFTDNMFCVFQALMPLNIPLRKCTGAFWGQCLERTFDECIDEGADAILAIDYDTVFTRADVEALIRLMNEHPEADVIAPLQSKRSSETPLLTLADPETGKIKQQVPWSAFEPELVETHTAHFGLTLIRVSALKKMPHPWFWSKPGSDGKWGEGRIDDDMMFWQTLREGGGRLFTATRVVVGHAELKLSWPGCDLNTIQQQIDKFYSDGAPAAVWRGVEKVTFTKSWFDSAGVQHMPGETMYLPSVVAKQLFDQGIVKDG
jgi:hypothetical protein